MTINNNPQEPSREPFWAKKSRLLTQALIFSGALNIGFLTTFIYSAIQKKVETVSFAVPAILTPHLSNEELLRTYATMPYAELLTLLDNQEVVEEGYKKRDLALASLAAFHFFNLEKALAGAAVQKRTLSFIHREGQERVDVTVYPGLADDQFQAVGQFAKTEKWPLTSEGIFFELKNAKENRDQALVETFYLSSEFHAVHSLFTRAGLGLPKEMVLNLLCQGDWE